MPLSEAILLKMDSSVILFYSLHKNFEIFDTEFQESKIKNLQMQYPSNNKEVVDAFRIPSSFRATRRGHAVLPPQDAHRKEDTLLKFSDLFPNA